MQTDFKNHINNALPFLKTAKLIIAISGGVDSVVLAHLCHKLQLDFTLAHCNFNLRAAESDKDEQFVIDLADALNVEIFTQHFDIEAYKKQHNSSTQMAARELRYNWFKDLAQQLQFNYILTAHHADDNLETFLINFSRGTGLNGLTGIPTINENIVRPLLPFSRAEILQYATEHKLSWREDSSNIERKYLRNKLRHEVIPILKQINPQLLDSFQNTLNHLNDTADIVTESLKAVRKRAVTYTDDKETHFKISEFKKVNNPKAYLFEMFKSYGFTEWNDVVGLLDAETGKQVFSSTHRLIKHRDHLMLATLQSMDAPQNPISINNAKPTKTPIGTLQFKNVNTIGTLSKHCVFIDADKIEFPLQLRPWKSGDIFYPSGMKGKKKLSKYLKDEKLSLLDKERTWVLCSNNNIIWVVSRRGDQRFRVTDKTKTILKIEVIS